MSEKLKPCLDCGDIPSPIPVWLHDKGVTVWIHRCGCGKQTGYCENQEKSAIQWNNMNRRQEAKPQTWREAFKDVPQCPQRQDSTDEQLADLRMVANRMGFYDAADYLRPPYSQKAKQLTVDQLTEILRRELVNNPNWNIETAAQAIFRAQGGNRE